MPIRFGIPNLDAMTDLSAREPKIGTIEPSTSVSIIGPDGSGKSILALHAASKYLADAWHLVNTPPLGAVPKLPTVLYISSDLKFSSAQKVWDEFGLHSPFLRAIPFENVPYTLERTNQSRWHKELKIQFVPVTPAAEAFEMSGTKQQTLPEFLAGAESVNAPDKLQVGFLDLATYTAGDDWSYVNKLLGQLAEGTATDKNRIPHLVVIDSVAGFETYVGTYDAFGYEQTRRSRIAQCTRTAGEACSLLFVVEESHTDTHLPEEYTTDAVFRLRRSHTGANYFRTIEIDKARAKDHATGQHVFEIRGKNGTSTGSWENADDPAADNAYLHVFPSLALRNNLIFRSRGVGKLVPKSSIAPFGVEHLDGLLDTGTRPGLEGLKGYEEPHEGSPRRSSNCGLPTSSVTALIGDSSTGKSQLAEAFLANNFLPIVDLFLSCYFALKYNQLDASSLGDILYLLGKGAVTEEPASPREHYSNTPVPDFSAFLTQIRAALEAGQAVTIKNLLFASQGNKLSEDFQLRLIALNQKAKLKKSHTSPLQNSFESRTEFLQEWETQNETQIKAEHPFNEFEQTHQGILNLLKFVFEHPNLMWPSVLITTSDQTSGLIAKRCAVYLTDHIQEAFGKWRAVDPRKVLPDAEQKELLNTLLRLLELQLIVRRADLRDSDSSVLLHMIQQNVVQAQELIFGPAFPEHAKDRFGKSRRIRLVIDDFRVLLNTRPTAAQDSTFMPFLPFYLDREGITALFVYTEAVKPNERPHDSLCATLMSLARQSLILWNVPFAGQKRVAVTILPAVRPEFNGVVRELKSEEDSRIKNLLSDEDAKQVQAYRRPQVTRYFELFSGIEDGQPLPVPLRIYVYRETKGFELHFERAEHLFQAVFGQNLSSPESPSEGIFQCLGMSQYQVLREMTHLPMRMVETQSIIFQVDGYWSLRPHEVLHDQSDFLAQKIDSLEKRHEELENDYFYLYGQCQSPPENRNGPYRRIDYFKNSYYKSRLIDFSYTEPRKLRGVPDRVPYMWDFGFLLGHHEAWELAKNRQIPGQNGELVKHIYKSLTDRLNPDQPIGENVSWRSFIGACQEVQRDWQRHRGKVLRIFDLALPSRESLNCLFLEIFFSELYLHRAAGLKPDMDELEANLCASVYLQKSFQSIKLEQLIWGKKTSDQRKTLINKWKRSIANKRKVPFKDIPIGYLALYKTWLLFLELFPVSPFDRFQQGDATIEESADSAVATRHWYKTACERPTKQKAQDEAAAGGANQILMRLAGRYSCRGDWFLASSRSSRSKLLTERAIDLMCSRRANIERLEQGLGLPVRDIAPDENCARFQTALKASASPKRKDSQVEHGENFSPGFLSYSQVADKAPQEIGDTSPIHFHPLWRTSIADYDRQARVLERWLDELIRSTKTYREWRGDRWDDPFKAYDELTAGETTAVSQYESFCLVAEHADTLVAWLAAAKRPPDA